MAAILLGRTNWEMERSEDGHRNYLIEWRIETDSPDDGPATVFNCPGLPTVGSWWAIANDLDLWAFCHPQWTCRPQVTEEANVLWILTQPFSTRPFKRCQDTQIENPLLEPPDISGSFVNYRKEATKDAEGKLILSSSLEVIRGAAVERDYGNHSIEITLNTLELGLDSYVELIHHVNDAPLWGLERRMIKFSNVRWQRLMYGTCTAYYRKSFTFDIDFGTFTYKIPDEGTKVLQGHAPGSTWPKLEPTDIDPLTGKEYRFTPWRFEVYKDKQGENTKVLLDGMGRPLDDSEDPHLIEKELYGEANLLQLGIPSSF